MNELKIVTEINSKKWSDFVYAHPNGNIFQTPEMFEVYKNTKKWKPIFLAVIDSKENILGILCVVIQKEFGGFLGKFTARAVVWGGPLIANTDKKSEIFELLLDALDKDLKNEVIYVQFRNLYEFSQDKTNFLNKNYIYEDHLDYYINLTFSEEELISKMSDSRRKNIKRASGSDLQMIEMDDPAGIEIFYDLLRSTYRRIKMPCPSLEFFNNAFRFLQNKGMLALFLISQKEKNIAGRAVLVHRNTIYDWYAGSTKEAFASYANDLIIWKIILWGKNKGCKLFDFGGAGSPDIYYGPGEYKRRFGGEQLNYGRFTKVYKKTMYFIIKRYASLLKRKVI